MLNLIKPIPPVPPVEDQDITEVVATRLQNLGILVVRPVGPVFQVEMCNGSHTHEIMSKQADDLDYAIEAINELNPVVFFLYKVILSERGYTFRFNYIATQDDVQ